MNKHIALALGMGLLLTLCLAGVVWTAYWSLRFGLAPRAPLSTFQTAVRLAAIITALLLAWVRTDVLERSALICAIVAAGSSALYGLGFNSVTLQVVRLLFHFLAYGLGAVAITLWFQAKIRRQQAAGVRSETIDEIKTV